MLPTPSTTATSASVGDEAVKVILIFWPSLAAAGLILNATSPGRAAIGAATRAPASTVNIRVRFIPTVPSLRAAAVPAVPSSSRIVAVARSLASLLMGGGIRSANPQAD